VDSSRPLIQLSHCISEWEKSFEWLIE